MLCGVRPDRAPAPDHCLPCPSEPTTENPAVGGTCPLNQGSRAAEPTPASAHAWHHPGWHLAPGDFLQGEPPGSFQNVPKGVNAETPNQLAGVGRGTELRQHTWKDTLKRLRLNNSREETKWGLSRPSCSASETSKACPSPAQGAAPEGLGRD